MIPHVASRRWLQAVAALLVQYGPRLFELAQEDDP